MDQKRDLNTKKIEESNNKICGSGAKAHIAYANGST